MPTLPSGQSLYALLLDAHRAQNSSVSSSVSISVSSSVNSTEAFNPLSSLLPLGTGPSLMERSAAPLSLTLAGTGTGAAAAAVVAGAGAGVRAIEGVGVGTRRLKGRGTRRGAGSGAGAGAGTSAGARAGAGTSAAGTGMWGGNALVQILQRIPLGDLEELQRGVERASSSFRYYQYNSSLQLNDKDIPTRCACLQYHRIISYSIILCHIILYHIISNHITSLVVIPYDIDSSSLVPSSCDIQINDYNILTYIYRGIRSFFFLLC